MISSTLEFFKNNIALLIFSIIGLKVFIAYFLPIINERVTNKFLWIYSSLIPSILLIIFRIDEFDKFKNFNYFDYFVFIILLLLLFIPLAIQFYILSQQFKLDPDSVGEMNIIEVHSEGLDSLKLMEYFVVLILPFITIGNSLTDGLTIFYVFVILIIIFFRLDLFYFNLPVMFYYRLHEVTLSDEKRYILISKNKVLDNSENKTRKIIILSEELKIAILIE